MVKEVNPLAEKIGSRIASRRKQLGLTQEQAAEKAGLSHQFFACVERGLKNIRAESIVKISKAMDISADYILTGISSDIDRSHIMSLMEPLTETQLKCLEEIVRNYLIACGHDKPKF
ncbi:MAG: helix-turn-helix domain-containing protein [Oscillospiraceae bacterium]|nr:helix-turn-helix domain-containing protein [Oscillospiraceae bacterium]